MPESGPRDMDLWDPPDDEAPEFKAACGHMTDMEFRYCTQAPSRSMCRECASKAILEWPTSDVYSFIEPLGD